MIPHDASIALSKTCKGLSDNRGLTMSLDQPLPQTTIIAMFGLPDVAPLTTCESESRSKPWSLKEWDARSAFLDAQQSSEDISAPSTAVFLNTLREESVVAALRKILEVIVQNWGISGLLASFRWSTSIFSKLYPHRSPPFDNVITQFSAFGEDWSQTKIRAFEWHPHTLKVAVATHDDTIHVYYGLSAEKTLIPTLKHPRQKNVADLKWRPYSSSGLGVAVQDGIILWTVDPNSLSARPASSSVMFFTLPGHRPVTSLAWGTYSGMLFSASPCDGKVVAWDVSREGVTAPLIAVSGGGVTLISFSPDGHRLLVATPFSEFQIWSSGSDWTNEKWTNLRNRVIACTWSPDSTTLLFAVDGDSLLYSVDFQAEWNSDGERKSEEQRARSILDLSKIDFDGMDGEIFDGASVHQMEWDPSGERLAISLRPQSGHRAVVAIFVTRFRRSVFGGSSRVEFFPGMIIRGNDDEPYAAKITYCPRYPPGAEPSWYPGALLAVVWAKNGRVSYHPLHFIPSPSQISVTLNSSVIAFSRVEASLDVLEANIFRGGLSLFTSPT